MEKTFNEMRGYLLTHLEINKEALKKVKKESLSSSFNQYLGELSLALCLKLITREEFSDFESKLLRVYSVRNCIPEEEIKEEYYSVEKLPFEEVPAEEQETLKVDDLPFPEVMKQEEQPAVPFEMMDAEERADEFFKSPEQPADDKQKYVESRYELWLDVCRKPDGCDEELLNYLHGYFTMAGELGAVTMHRAEDMVHELTHECGKPCSLLAHLLEYGRDPEKYMLLADGISVINRALVHEALHHDEGLRDALEALREEYTDVIKRMKEGWDGVVTNESLLDIREWIDDQADWLD